MGDDDQTQWRSTLAQMVASVAVNTISIQSGVSLGMQVFIIGALRSPQLGPDLHFTADQSSWYGGISYITNPVGSLIYSLFQDSLSRKAFLVSSNVFQLGAYLVMYRATSFTELITAQAAIGLSSGLSKPASYSYLGETMEPRLRGTLSALGGVFLNVGLILATIVGASFDWRTMVLYFSATPVISFLAILVIPESPAWLVLKRRIPEAERSFQWLRGWVPAHRVQTELHALVNYVKSKSFYENQPKDSPQDTKKTQESAWRDLLQPAFIRPMRLLLILHFTATCTGLTAPKTFFKEVAANLNLPFSVDQALVYLHMLTMLGAVVLTLTLGRLGKRRLTFISLTLCITSCLGLGLHVLLGCPWSWPPFIFLGLAYFGTQLGLFNITWILISEVFPLRSRSLMTGVTSGCTYLISFVIIKTFYTVMAALGLAGTFFLYGTVGLVGSVYLYLSLPETEGVTLEEIERFFVPDKSRDYSEKI